MNPGHGKSTGSIWFTLLPKIAILAGFLGPARTFDPKVPCVCIWGLRGVTNLQEQPLGFRMNSTTDSSSAPKLTPDNEKAF